MTDVERVNAFATGGPFTWRAEDGSTDFNAMRVDLLAALSTPAASGDGNAFRPMEAWDQRDEPVMLLVDYRGDGDHPLEDANFAITVGHNDDHNVGDGEGTGWHFAGWCWSHDHYVEGRGKPVGWMPLPHILARAYAAFDGEPILSTPAASGEIPGGVVARMRELYATHEAWPVDKYPRSGAPSEEWEPYSAANRARRDLLDEIPALLDALITSKASAETGRYLSDRFQWAAPGDQQEDAWLVRFCDNDVRDAIYTGPDAESEAWAAWNRHAPGYNMYVFRLAALSAAPSAPATETGARYRHVKRGTEYEVIGEAELQTVSGALVDGSALVIYRGDDGKVWAREEGEFHDGRFTPTDQVKDDGKGGGA